MLITPWADSSNREFISPQLPTAWESNPIKAGHSSNQRFAPPQPRSSIKRITGHIAYFCDECLFLSGLNLGEERLVLSFELGDFHR